MYPVLLLWVTDGETMEQCRLYFSNNHCRCCSHNWKIEFWKARSHCTYIQSRDTVNFYGPIEWHAGFPESCIVRRADCEEDWPIAFELQERFWGSLIAPDPTVVHFNRSPRFLGRMMLKLNPVFLSNFKQYWLGWKKSTRQRTKLV